MPTYEYQCEQCGERFETFQSIKDDPVKTCPKCRAPVRRLFGTGAAVIVAGSGSDRRDYAQGTPRCGRGTPCCGRDVPCDRPPCDK